MDTYFVIKRLSGQDYIYYWCACPNCPLNLGVYFIRSYDKKVVLYTSIPYGGEHPTGLLAELFGAKPKKHSPHQLNSIILYYPIYIKNEMDNPLYQLPNGMDYVSIPLIFLNHLQTVVLHNFVSLIISLVLADGLADK